MGDLTTHTKYPHRIFIADDNSNHPQIEEALATLEREHSNLRVIRSTHRRGFAANNNNAVQFTSAKNILLLNQDCYLQQGALEEMVMWLALRKSVGIVGAKLLFPAEKGLLGGRIQHIGVARYADAAPYHRYREEDARIPEAQVYRWVNAVIGACLLVTREIWNLLGGLDQTYSMGQFEDVDMCYRARYNLGARILVTPKAVGFHYEHGTGEQYIREGHDMNRHIQIG